METVMNMNDLRIQTACFTGHRDIDPARLPAIVSRIAELLKSLLARGVTDFAVGGAVGFDMIAAEYLIRLREEAPGTPIRILSILPWPGWMENWTEEEIAREKRILENSDQVLFVAQAYSDEVYLVRDRALVDRSSFCISCCDRPCSGTAYTVQYALSRGIPVANTSPWDISRLAGSDMN